MIPFCDIAKDEETGEIRTQYSLEIQILDSLKKRFNFTAALTNANQDWGILINGSWTGVMGQVLNKASLCTVCIVSILNLNILFPPQTTQMGICGISQTKEREKYVDFTRYIYLNALTFVSRSPGLAKREWIVAHPFQPLIWVLIFVYLLGISLLIYFVTAKHSRPQLNVLGQCVMGILLNQCKFV